MTGELDYTEQEVACIDPDMADLAIERGIRRPASGMPDDWVGVGAAIAPPPIISTTIIITIVTNPRGRGWR